MAKLLLIKSTVAGDDRQAGDIVGIFKDDHTFSVREQEYFDIVKVDDSDRNLNTQYPKLIPKLFWEDPTDGVLKEVVKEPRFWIQWDGAKVLNNIDRYTENSEKTISAIDTSKKG